VFSPYYARARDKGTADPKNHCAINVALYGPGGRWAMTERGRATLVASPDTLSVGPSTLHWRDDRLTIDIDEIAAPLPRRVRGRVTLYPRALTGRSYAIDTRGRHIWRPIAPDAAVEVNLMRPSLRWSGRAYFDSNRGSEPLEDGFEYWNWSRAPRADGTLILYDLVRRDDSRELLALHCDASGRIEPFEAPPPAALPVTGWRVPRSIRAEPGHCARVVRTLEDTPFYARSIVSTSLLGGTVEAVHESLSLARFRRPWVRLLLPFRMPRRAGRR